MEGAVTSWLARSSLDRVVLVRALVGYIAFVLRQDTHSASLHPGVEIGTGEFNAGGNPAMD